MRKMIFNEGDKLPEEIINQIREADLLRFVNNKPVYQMSIFENFCIIKAVSYQYLN